MKERPILMSGEMVRKSLAHSKTHTRRTRGLERVNESPDDWGICSREGTNELAVIKQTGEAKAAVGFYSKHDSSKGFFLLCPYGQVGDLLWVRETFAHSSGDCRDESNGEGDCYVYRATWEGCDLTGCWKPSIHMPRKACRLLLEIVDIRVERLRSISDGDVAKEGVSWYLDPSKPWSENEEYRKSSSALWAFRSLWVGLNGLDSWELDPWVWVIVFKVKEVKS